MTAAQRVGLSDEMGIEFCARLSDSDSAMNNPNNETLISAANLTASAAKGIRTILAGYDGAHACDGVTIVTLSDIEHHLCSFDNREAFVSFRVRTSRTDCDEHSPRAVVCNEGGYFFVTPRGSLTMASNYSLCSKQSERALRKALTQLKYSAAIARLGQR